MSGGVCIRNVCSLLFSSLCSLALVKDTVANLATQAATFTAIKSQSSSRPALLLVIILTFFPPPLFSFFQPPYSPHGSRMVI